MIVRKRVGKTHRACVGDWGGVLEPGTLSAVVGAKEEAVEAVLSLGGQFGHIKHLPLGGGRGLEPAFLATMVTYIPENAQHRKCTTVR